MCRSTKKNRFRNALTRVVFLMYASYGRLSILRAPLVKTNKKFKVENNMNYNRQCSMLTKNINNNIYNSGRMIFLI